MSNLRESVQARSGAKLLAILAYGESVAAYRYRTLADRTARTDLRGLLEEMADEEQGHHLFIQHLLASHYPGADFVLADGDKALVAVGPRQLSFFEDDAFARALDLVEQTERATGALYAELSEHPPRPELASTFRDMATECFEHAEKVRRMAAGL